MMSLVHPSRCSAVVRSNSDAMGWVINCPFGLLDGNSLTGAVVQRGDVFLNELKAEFQIPSRLDLLRVIQGIVHPKYLWDLIRGVHTPQYFECGIVDGPHCYLVPSKLLLRAWGKLSLKRFARNAVLSSSLTICYSKMH